jgi:hypothetical protein
MRLAMRCIGGKTRVEILLLTHLDVKTHLLFELCDSFTLDFASMTFSLGEPLPSHAGR